MGYVPPNPPPDDKPHPIESERIADMGQRTSPPEPIPAEHKPSGYIYANDDVRQRYYGSWTIWKLVMALGIAFTGGGLVYMILLVIQHMIAR